LHLVWTSVSVGLELNRLYSWRVSSLEQEVVDEDAIVTFAVELEVVDVSYGIDVEEVSPSETRDFDGRAWRCGGTDASVVFQK